MTQRGTEEIHLLHVDDEPDFAEMTGEFLEREDEQFSVETATSAKEGLDYISEHEIDCVVSDYNMPGQTGIEFLETIRAENPHLPFILFTGKGSEEVASEAISASVTDYMQKGRGTDQYAILANRIKNSVQQSRAEQETERTKQRLQELTESTTDCRWMFTSDWDDLLYISGYEEIWKRPAAAIKANPQDFLDAVHPADQQSVRQAMERLSNGDAFDIEYRILRGDDTTGWVWVKGEPIFDEEGNVVRVVGLTRDITERKDHERQLERTTERMEFVLRSFDSGIWEYEYETETVTSYPEPCPIFGMECDSLDGFFEKIRPADHEQLESALTRAAETGHSVRLEIRLVENVEAEWVELDLRPILDDDGEIAKLTGLTRDITEHKSRKRALERARERMQLALDQTNSIIFEIECDTSEVVRHGAYTEFFDLPSDEAPTWEDHLVQAVHPDDRDRFQQFYQQLIDGAKDGGQLEYRTAPEFGDVRWIRDTASVQYASAGSRRHILGIAREITEYKERERELRRSERRYQAIFDDPNILVGLLDTDGTVLDINETAMAYINTSREEVLGESLWKAPWFTHSNAVQEDVKEWVGRAADGEYVEFEAELVRPNDEPYSVEGVIRPVTDDDGDVVSLVISDRDITERKERQRELERYHAYLEESNDGVTVLDESGTIQYQSPTVTRILGYEPETQLGESGFDLVHPDDRDDLSAAFADLLAEPESSATAEARFQTADGEWRWLEVSARNKLNDPAINGVVTNNRDITARKDRERRLKALNETTQRLIAADTRTEVAEIGINAASDILGLDANAVHLYDEEKGLVPVAQTTASHDLLGDPPTFTDSDSIAWRVYEQGEARAIEDVHNDPEIFNPNSPVRGELILPLGEAGILIASSPMVATFTEQDRVLGEILSGNITSALEQVEQTEKLHAREQELVRQNERLQEFTSVASHDLQNPLQVAHGRLELVMDECDHEQLDAVQQALDRMTTLIEDLLTLARRGERVDEMEPVDLAVISQTCWQHVVTAMATLQINTDNIIWADRSRLQQLLENLIRNAIEHGGDDITVTIGDLETGFYMADDGPGITAETHDSIFDAGYSTAEDGTGFGLSIVKQVVDAHGWDITITDSDGGGTRFEITNVENMT